MSKYPPPPINEYSVLQMLLKNTNFRTYFPYTKITLHHDASRNNCFDIMFNAEHADISISWNAPGPVEFDISGTGIFSTCRGHFAGTRENWIETLVITVDLFITTVERRIEAFDVILTDEHADKYTLENAQEILSNIWKRKLGLPC